MSVFGPKDPGHTPPPDGCSIQTEATYLLGLIEGGNAELAVENPDYEHNVGGGADQTMVNAPLLHALLVAFLWRVARQDQRFDESLRPLVVRAVGMQLSLSILGRIEGRVLDALKDALEEMDCEIRPKGSVP